MARILIVEDEFIIAHDIKMILEKLGHEVAGSAENAEDALKLLKEANPELILLDINLEGEIDGVQIGSIIKADYKLPFIYLTAFADKKTLERVKLTDPYGYIVKPFTDKDLESNIELALYKFDKDLKKAREPAESGEDLVKQDTLYAKVNHKLVKIRLDDIKWIQAMDNYAVIQTISKKYVVSNTLKELNEKMQSRDMVRIHRSFIIHLDKVDTIEFSALHIDDEEIPIGKSYKHNLMKRIKLI